MNLSTPALRRAAQYLRVSTGIQKYSIESQEVANAAYAAGHGIEIVRTYSDGGKSGVTLKKRTGLQQLLDDVCMGTADFEVILVYDVSRWGRFQNSDQAAFYDYTCLAKGVKVIYIAEGFSDDDSPLASLLKALKRGMAGEFSRELSVKVRAGLAHRASKGYALNGRPLLGIRRHVIRPDGTTRCVLGVNEKKAYLTDHLVNALGPLEEVELVRSIYRMYLREGATLRSVCRQLNAAGHRDIAGGSSASAPYRKSCGQNSIAGIRFGAGNAGR